MADIMKQAVERAYADIVQACGEFDIAIVGESCQNRIDQNLTATQQTRIGQLPTINLALTNLTADFSDNEQTYYEFLREQAEVDESNDEAVEEFAEITTAASGNPIRLKYILVGAVGGVFLACCWIAFRYIIDSRLHTEEDLRYFGGIQNLATVPFPAGKRRFLHSIDCLIEKLLNGGKNTLSYEESIQLASSYLEVLISKKIQQDFYYWMPLE